LFLLAEGLLRRAELSVSPVCAMTVEASKAAPILEGARAALVIDP
jgi:hypothetical protein